MRLKFTTRGRAALVNAAHTGTKAVTVTQIGVTDRAFTPDPAGGDLVLPGERKRLTTFGGKAVADDVVHLTVRDESDDSYPLRGIALYLEDGTLLALYGGSEVILEKSSQAMMLLALDWILADMDANQIQFGNTDFLNPPATTEMQGVVELATAEEAITGKDSQRAVTASALLATLDARLGKAAPSVLGKAIIGRGDAAEVRTDLGLRSAALKDEGSGKGLDADSVDGKHATDFAAKQHTHTISDITDLAPARLLPAGLVAHFPTASPPEGWLRCNGADVSRTTYAALFAVIGTTFGSASGSTFRLPDLRGEFIRGWDDGRGADNGRALGSYQADEFKSHDHQGPTAAGTQNGSYEVPAAPGYNVYDYVGAAPVSATGGAETRPRNVALLACIKF
ncbi:tail fiber protein [Stenotrophomonas maltophilia]|uniref:tail fiber protein n=1 Tax=Stenotrophomonas maltophilia TaxID=40324 RepID=UPI00195453E5|nr:tail fiber protein [Stenotrophomonas maltophilia]